MKEYVRKRVPCVLNSRDASKLTKRAAKFISGNDCELRRVKVAIESKQCNQGTFGTSSQKQVIEFGDFIQLIRKKDTETDYYLSTQYGIDSKCAISSVLMQRDVISQVPALVDASQCQMFDVNLWMGSAEASSRLHFDYHDNLYYLCEGEKQFILFSPSCAPNLYLNTEEHGIDQVLIDCDGDIEFSSEAQRKRSYRSSDEEDNYGSGSEEEQDSIIATGKRQRVDSAEGFDSEIDSIDWNGRDDFDEEIMLSGNSNYGDDSDSNSDSEAASTILSDNVESDALNSKSKSEKDPPSFSRIPVDVLHSYVQSKGLKLDLQDRSKSGASLNDFPLLRKCDPTVVTLKAGQCLFLPAGWFHEVSSRCVSKSNFHLAINYWFNLKQK
ncbi:hypothetical protein MP228_011264 [Amoeboaphelidium protococcarum]|nr:hypothetical protein MP228_011264 [Amoeboaphelidium protococcarum]